MVREAERALVIALDRVREKFFFQILHLLGAHQLAAVDGAPTAGASPSTSVLERRGSALFEIVEKVPRGLERGTGGQRREERDRCAESLKFFQGGARGRASIGSQDRRRNTAAGLSDLVAGLERVDPDEVRAAALYI